MECRTSKFCWPCIYTYLYTRIYNFVNKTNLVHTLFLVYLSISTCFGPLWAHHQEKQLCFHNLCLLFYAVDCPVCRVECKHFHSTLHTGQSSTQNNRHQVSQKHSFFSWWWAHSGQKHVEIDKYTENKLCTKLVLSTRNVKHMHVNKQWKFCSSVRTVISYKP